jgi:hypothetical protein
VCRRDTSRSTGAWSSTRTGTSSAARSAAIAERASFGSFLSERPVPNSRTRDASVAGISTTCSHLVSKARREVGRQFVSDDHQRSTDATNHLTATPHTQSGSSALRPFDHRRMRRLVKADLTAARESDLGH